jgi:hypothetical protein
MPQFKVVYTRNQWGATKHCFISFMPLCAGAVECRNSFIFLPCYGTPFAKEELWDSKSPKDLSADW